MHRTVVAVCLTVLAILLWGNFRFLGTDWQVAWLSSTVEMRNSQAKFLETAQKLLDQLALAKAREGDATMAILPTTIPTKSQGDATTPALAPSLDSTLTNASEDMTGFAYVFYATTEQYACSALVNIWRLQRELHSKVAIHVLVSSSIRKDSVAAFEGANATVHVQEVPSLPTNIWPYYHDCLLKMLAFKMHMIQPGLKRILALDADQLLMKNLDALFTGLPQVDLAAPRAYWLSKDFFASTFLMINLSDRLWKKVKQGMEKMDPS